MSRFWRPVVATGVVLASWCGNVEISEAAGRIAERLPATKASAPKEPRERERLRDRERERSATDENSGSSRLLPLRSSSEGRLTARTGKRKDAPPEAKAATQSLDEVGGLKIDLGDTVETLDADTTSAPPVVPPTEEETPGASARPSRDQRNERGAPSSKTSRRSTSPTGGAAASTAARPQELLLNGPRSLR